MSAPKSNALSGSVATVSDAHTSPHSPSRLATSQNGNAGTRAHVEDVSAGIREVQALWDRRERAARRDRAIFKTALLSAMMHIS